MLDEAQFVEELEQLADERRRLVRLVAAGASARQMARGLGQSEDWVVGEVEVLVITLGAQSITDLRRRWWRTRAGAQPAAVDEVFAAEPATM